MKIALLIAFGLLAAIVLALIADKSRKPPSLDRWHDECVRSRKDKTAD